jgi:hypothetical protein
MPARMREEERGEHQRRRDPRSAGRLHSRGAGEKRWLAEMRVPMAILSRSSIEEIGGIVDECNSIVDRVRLGQRFALVCHDVGVTGIPDTADTGTQASAGTTELRPRRVTSLVDQRLR